MKMSEINSDLKNQKVSDISIPKKTNIERQIDEHSIILDFSIFKKIIKFEKCVCKIEL